MPMAAPISLVASLTAEATPCFSSGAVVMIADVAGDMTNPRPSELTTSGPTRSKNVASESRIVIHSSPTASRDKPADNANRSPIQIGRASCRERVEYGEGDEGTIGDGYGTLGEAEEYQQT